MRRHALLVLSAILFLPVAAWAADGHGSHNHQMTSAAANDLTEGTIKKIGPAQDSVTLTHGPIANLGMDGMTMAFKVKEPKQLSGLKVGNKVRFAADMAGGEVVIVRIEAVK